MADINKKEPIIKDNWSLKRRTVSFINELMEALGQQAF